MGTYAEQLASVSISRSTRTPSQQGFGTPLVAVYHTLFGARVRSYGSLAAMVADGFTPYDWTYRAVAAAFAQNPAPPIVKVGRRVLPFTQVVNVWPSDPASASIAETYAVKVDGLTATFTSDATPTVSEVVTGLTAAINALGDVDAIVTSRASPGSDLTLTGSTLNGVLGASSLSTPRFITVVLSAHANWDATTAVLSGIDGNGNAITENLAIPDGGDATLTSTKKYLRVTSLLIPAQSGTSGSFTVGVRAPVTAVATGGTRVVCTSAVGELHSYEVTTSNSGLTDTTADPGIATDLNAINTADADWYGLLLEQQGAAEITAAAAWVETAKKEFVWQSADMGGLDGSVSTDIFYTTDAAGYVRSAGDFYPSIGVVFKAAAWMGEEFPKEPGLSTWTFKTLAGIPVYSLTDTQRLALEAKNGNHYLSAGGIAITGPGNSASGEWLDVVRDLDFATARLREAAIGVFASNDKVPFTDEGISLLAAAVRAVLKDCVRRGIFASFTLTVPKAADVSSADKAARHLPNVNFTAVLTGAVHSITVSGNVSA